ncbi:MAG: endonuclease III [Saprospiraceae bacterium]|nr:endonuclease III [Saprospiraceae bacterium]
MNLKEKSSFIIAKLDELFPEVPIPLIHKDPFTLLVAVVLSAQCTDERVNLITPKLFKLADTPEKMASLSPEQIKEVIISCGLSGQKSKAIHRLSEIIRDNYENTVPSSFEALESLPGVGHKTASVVMSQAYGIPAFPVDTHIHRLAYRWGLSSGKNVEQTEKDLKHLFPEDLWNKLHLQIIYYGRKYCPARNHKIDSCPICQRLGS